MDETTVSQREQVWLGKKPDSQTRLVIGVASVSLIVGIFLYGVYENYRGNQSGSGEWVLGILSGLVASGSIALYSWFVYDSYLPNQRHKEFRPHIDGEWFGYYAGGKERVRIPEFVYIKQVADKVSGTMTNPENVVYDFTGQIVLGTLVLTWLSHDSEQDASGAIVMRPLKPKLWSGLQISGHSTADEHHEANQVASMPYLLSRTRITDEEWKQWLEQLDHQNP